MKVTEIQGATLGIVKIVNGPKAFRLTIQDQQAGEVIWIDLTQEVADQIIAKLTSGIQIAKGLPH